MADVNVIGILDMSGSMGVIADDLRGGYNSYLDGLQEDQENTYTISTTLFDTEFIELHKQQPVHTIARLDKLNYQPRGNTALWDAVGHTLNGIRNMENEKVLCVIYTDGMENSSREYTAEQVKKMIEDRKSGGNWDFIFLGTGVSAWSIGEKVGLGATSYSTQKTAAATGQTFSTLRSATMSYAGGKAATASEEFRKSLPDDAKESDPEDPKNKEWVKSKT